MEQIRIGHGSVFAVWRLMCTFPPCSARRQQPSHKLQSSISISNNTTTSFWNSGKVGIWQSLIFGFLRYCSSISDDETSLKVLASLTDRQPGRQLFWLPVSASSLLYNNFVLQVQIARSAQCSNILCLIFGQFQLALEAEMCTNTVFVWAKT